MRKAEEFVGEYRSKGYPDERIRIIASMRPEPLRSEALRILDKAVLHTDANTTLVAQPVPERNEAPVATKSAPAEEPTPIVQTTAPKTVAASQEQTPVSENTPAPAAPEKPEVAKAAPVQTPSTAKIFDAMRKKVSALRKERDHLNQQLKHANSKVQSLCVKAEEAGKLRIEVAQVQSVEKELAALQARQAEAAKAKAGLEMRISELESDLAGKQAAITEKDRINSETQAELAEERTERTRSASHASELHQLVERQSGRLNELGDLESDLANANATLEKLQQEAKELHGRERINTQRVGELENGFESAQTEVAALRGQIKTNEESLDALQGTLEARECELDSLREHFENEALDLKKRADQEMWIIRRKLSVFRRASMVGGAVAAMLLLVFGISLFIGGGGETQPSELKALVAEVRAENNELKDELFSLRNLARRDDLGGDSMRMRDTIMKAPPIDPPNRTREERTPRYKIYTVVKGDSFSRISKKFYGTEAKWKAIPRANNLSEKHTLQPGMKLKIPQLPRNE